MVMQILNRRVRMDQQAMEAINLIYYIIHGLKLYTVWINKDIKIHCKSMQSAKLTSSMKFEAFLIQASMLWTAIN